MEDLNKQNEISTDELLIRERDIYCKIKSFIHQNAIIKKIIDEYTSIYDEDRFIKVRRYAIKIDLFKGKLCTWLPLNYAHYITELLDDKLSCLNKKKYAIYRVQYNKEEQKEYIESLLRETKVYLKQKPDTLTIPKNKLILKRLPKENYEPKDLSKSIKSVDITEKFNSIKTVIFDKMCPLNDAILQRIVTFYIERNIRNSNGVIPIPIFYDLPGMIDSINYCGALDAIFNYYLSNTVYNFRLKVDSETIGDKLYIYADKWGRL